MDLQHIVVWILQKKKHFETQTPVDFITIAKQSPYTSMVILIIFIP